jgi:hypothetical protein
MNNILNYINEAKEAVKWVAIEVTSENVYIHGSKPKTSQRVVSYETYLELKDTRRTKGGQKVLSIDTLGPATRNKEEAMSYLDGKKRGARKSTIDKGDAKYIVYTINCGKFNVNGNTKFGWNIYTNDKDSDEKGVLYTDGSSFLYGVEGSLKVGDTVCCIDNDTQVKVKSYSAPKQVKAILPCTSEEDFIEAYRKAFPNLCKPKKYAFGKLNHGLPVSRMGQIYSIKGISE